VNERSGILPINDWPLAWRFDEIPEVARHVDVLSEAEDKKLREWVRSSYPVTTKSLVPEVVSFNMERVREDEGLDYLFSLKVDPNEHCTVIYVGPFRSCRMPIELCFRHFYDVWYPGSDDIWIVNQSRTWIIECTHHGSLRFFQLEK
jgi:hypothetical protein